MSELFDAADALIASRSPLPPPAERRRLRQAHGLTPDEAAPALQARRARASGWESGKTEPRPPERDAYARMLKQRAQLHPADPNVATDTAVPEPLAVPAVPASTRAEPAKARTEPPGPILEPAFENTALRPAAVTRSAATTRPTSRRPPARTAAPAGSTDPRFENGPLAVIDVDADGQAYAYCVGGLVLDVPAKSVPALVDWTLREAKLGQPKLSGPGKDADPLLVLTESALERYGLPVALTDEEWLAGTDCAGPQGNQATGVSGMEADQAGGSAGGRGSTVPRPVRSGPASSCASRRGTRWTSGTGARQLSSLPRNLPVCWVCTRPA